MPRLMRQDDEEKPPPPPSGDLLRSERMCMVQMIVQHDAAEATVEELGELGSLMFVDLNEGVTSFQRNFVSEMKRCDEMERHLRFIEEQVALAGLTLSKRSWMERPGALNELQSQLEEYHNDLHQLNGNQTKLVTSYNHLVELSHVLQKCDDIFSEARSAQVEVVPRSLSFAEDLSAQGAAPTELQLAPLPPVSFDLEKGGRARGGAAGGGGLGGGRAPPETRLGYVTGVLDRKRLQAFERVLFRATRGNMYMRSAPIMQQVRDPKTGELMHKSVFIIFFSGQRSHDKVAKICDSFGGNRYTYPSQFAARTSLLAEVQGRIDELQQVIERTLQHREERLTTLADRLHAWRTHVLKQKAVFRTLNQWNYDLTRKCLIAEAWCPVSKTDATQAALRRGTARSGAQVPSILNVIETDEKPPTYFRLNKFTMAFQAIVDAYGIPRYGEINPTPFVIVTFPFLFGVMFGDVGHGMLVTLFAAYFIAKEKHFTKLENSREMNELVSYPWNGRYVLLLMGLFSIYCGLLYNDFFGNMANLFGSTWEEPVGGAEGAAMVRKEPGAVYPFGLDPAWHRTSNEISFANSYKMKLSIVLGVSQMLLGLTCSLINALHFRSELDVWCEFVPQAIFMLSIFGYLVFAIFYKWSVDWVAIAEPAPSLISMLISFFMSPGTIPPDAVLFSGQATVQTVLLFLAFVTVPWMLLSKPLLLRRKHLQVSGYKTLKATSAEGSRLIDDADCSDTSSDKNGKYHHEEFDFAEVMIHQGIHSIEYVLGCISNTASYLRLWALSLAHKQLSAVFWEMIMDGFGLGLCKAGANVFTCAVPLVAAFCIWSCCTVGILCCMELLSAFLHALRLHWVEFQNKFYKGDGRKFEPFSFEEEIKRAGDD